MQVHLAECGRTPLCVWGMYIYKISLRSLVRNDEKAITKTLIRADKNTSKSNCARKKVHYLGVEEGDARANAYYRCGWGCTLLIYVARYV